MGYLLIVDDKATTMSDSLGIAKKEAISIIQNKIPVRIESFVAPAESQIWIYDYSIKDWVEQGKSKLA